MAGLGAVVVVNFWSLWDSALGKRHPRAAEAHPTTGVNPSEDEREKPARLSMLKKIGQPPL